jgi:hypothetical protein
MASSSGPTVTPEEIRFRWSLNKQLLTTVVVNNSASAKRCGFKIKTTAPKKYVVRPSSGVVEAGATTTVQVRGGGHLAWGTRVHGARTHHHVPATSQVIMQAQKEYPVDFANCKDKFMVQVTELGEGEEIDAATTFSKEAKGDALRESRLRVVLEGPAAPPSPVPEGEEASAATEAGGDRALKTAFNDLAATSQEVRSAQHDVRTPASMQSPVPVHRLRARTMHPCMVNDNRPSPHARMRAEQLPQEQSGEAQGGVRHAAEAAGCRAAGRRREGVGIPCIGQGPGLPDPHHHRRDPRVPDWALPRKPLMIRISMIGAAWAHGRYCAMRLMRLPCRMGATRSPCRCPCTWGSASRRRQEPAWGWCSHTYGALSAGVCGWRDPDADAEARRCSGRWSPGAMRVRTQHTHAPARPLAAVLPLRVKLVREREGG